MAIGFKFSDGYSGLKWCSRMSIRLQYTHKKFKCSRIFNISEYKGINILTFHHQGRKYLKVYSEPLIKKYIKTTIFRYILRIRIIYHIGHRWFQQ